ncbi:hypothetical protein CEUSTIGMA_g3908.t1 [Chlamydomonas eustigma]|uniref:Helicase ATP-binding domain-containing protein n=1 Tax=Chlamydomonas eustigma TaxID=1157962 RepID=A0A250X056_9CHLO|nr:hypothetical protein CEUSTIGMA_g3908.t1 [Chlamydomonas eustigma]|eukprot:GAX76463.1 hypothetical protein CEUSTIGMA_g3908.t1 [Chlamydomonas eustigma]
MPPADMSDPRPTGSFKIGGFDVKFPNQPYGVQFMFMNKMIQALQDRKSNALLEAPTGSGKTLSLLCAALAWQVKQKEVRSAALKAALLDERAAMNRLDEIGLVVPEGLDTVEDEELFLDDPAGPITGHPFSSTNQKVLGAPKQQGTSSLLSKLSDEPQVPKIFFATRTHSQISQVVKELKRSGYKPSMAVLAARQHYCINKAVVSSGKVDEECDLLIKKDGFGCRFHSKDMRMRNVPQVEVHDIEDLKSTCRSAKMCPYFGARELSARADLIFCPYG